MSVGPWQIVLIALLVLLLFGAGRLSEIGKGLGEGIRNFKKGISDEDEDDDEDDDEDEREVQHKRVKGKARKDPKRLPAKRRIEDEDDQDGEGEDDEYVEEEPAPRKKSKA